MKINEIFKTIQGEGILSGFTTIFVRTAGCNLRCAWCDTEYAYYNGKELTAKEILSKIRKFSCKRICITGGEPLLQKDITDLLLLLLRNKYEISIETNGSKSIAHLPKKTMISLDIKCPSSKEHKKMLFNNLRYLTKKDQCKFIINGKKDYNYAKNIVKKYNLLSKTNIFFIQVGGVKVKNIINFVLKDNLDIRVGVQLHKVTGAFR